MLNVKDPGQYTRSVRPLVPRSPEEHEEQLAPYAWGPDDLEAALAGLSREDLDQARAEQWTIICLAPGLNACGSRASLGAAMRAVMRTERRPRQQTRRPVNQRRRNSRMVAGT
jgi:hypothetical protein